MSSDVNSTSDVQVCDECEVNVDLLHYRRAEEDRSKLARELKRKSAVNFVLDPPDCTASKGLPLLQALPHTTTF